MSEERKLVTVLFADVTGSTGMGEDLDPEDVRALMGRYYDHARRVISDHGGTVEKFIGDAVMAVFGLPHAHGDDAERAVVAALALQKAMEDDPILGEMVLRIGINTGEVVATTESSSGDFLVTGDAVNVAARLQQSASPGEVLISQRTQGATAAAFHFGDVRDLEVKGKREPLQVFVVNGVRATRQTRRPPLVGRKQDLAQLSLLVDRALEERRPQLVSIVAPAGTGKTRLLEEFLERLDADDGFKVAIGRCPPYGQTLTYWPLRSLLEDLVGASSTDAVAGVFLRGGYSGDDADRLAYLVMATLGVESENVTERDSIFGAWRLLIETLAREAPRIVVFEDLHWASDSLLDLVEHVMHPRTEAPLVMVAISRPELLDRRPGWGGGRESFTALALRPLNHDHTAQLVEQLGEHLPHELRARIVEQSGGNPFYAVELVRGMAERRLSGATDNVLPDTVHAAVLARLDLLSPLERQALQAASVAGRTFRSATVASMVDNPGTARINVALEGLVARDLTSPTEGDAYVFRHALIRDVAYGTLSRTERIRMHGAVATWLEAYAHDRLDEFVELLAYHYREAVSLSRRSTVPLSLPIDPARAQYFLERAGELAGQSGAFGEARTYLQSAIDIAPPDQRMRLYEKLGDCAILGPVALGAYQEALNLWRAESQRNPLVGARLLRKLLILYTRLRVGVTHPSQDEMIEMREEARRLAEKAGDVDELWRIRVADLWWPQWRSDWGDGTATTVEDAEQGRHTGLAAAAYFEERGDWEYFSVALDASVSLSSIAGAHDEVIEVAKRRLNAPHITTFERSDALYVMAWAYNHLGHYDRCIAEVQDALREVRPGELIVHLASALAAASSAAWRSGRWSELSHFLHAIEEARQQSKDDSRLSPQLPGYHSALQLALARDDRAAADAAFSVLQSISENPSQAPYLDACREDDPNKLDLDPSHFDTQYPVFSVLMFLVEHDVRPPAALIDFAAVSPGTDKLDLCVRVLAIAQALADEDPQRLRVAIDDAEKHGLIPHAARMRIVLAEMTHDPEPLAQARPVLERLEDRQFLRRLEEVAASLRYRCCPLRCTWRPRATMPGPRRQLIPSVGTSSQCVRPTVAAGPEVPCREWR